uniref:ETFB lysine methyltransferase n=1 Tax=Lygus hesperus TaxID=30085 RepID=A0A146LS71_LYGHE
MRLVHSHCTGVFSNRIAIRNAIAQLTKICTSHLTPELKIRLITPESYLWKCKPEECPFVDPFWAFYWAGGQAVTRYILDNTAVFSGSNVLDVGSGCGASAIAAVKAGARNVFANDIDRVACEAISINAYLNAVKVHIVNHNILARSKKINNMDILIVGDMFYDTEFGLTMLTWLLDQKKCSRILIGDPGRHGLIHAGVSLHLKLLAEYQLLDLTVMENNGFKTSSVWELL